MTLDEMETLEKEYLTPAEVGSVLGVTPYSITVQVREDKKKGINSFCFPTIMIGTRVKIPRRPFIEVMKHGNCGNV